MTQLADLVDPPPSIDQVRLKLAERLTNELGYNGHLIGSSDAVLI
jgi:hypothetical protein